MAATSIAGIVTAVMAAASTAYTMSQGSPEAPEAPTTMPKMPGEDAAKAAKTLLPGTRANAAASGLGGSAPEFLAGMVDQNTGMPGGGLDILEQIRRSMGQGGGMQAP